MRSFILGLMAGFGLLTQAATPIDLDAVRQQYHLPALGVSLVDATGTHTTVVGVRKMGDPTPARVDDPFHLGSCGKSMTATLVAIFIERGLLNWDQTLSDLFPEWKDSMSPAFRKVPLAWLTAMHSGIGEKTDDLLGKLSDPALDPREGRRWVAHEILFAEPSATPGTQFIYSNLNYVIAGAILERLTGKPWETLMREEIFESLGMKTCGFGTQGDPKADPPVAPWPHEFQQGVPVPVPPDFKADYPPTIAPAGSIFCSLGDWAKYVRVHLEGGAGKTTRLLQAKSFVKLHTVYPAPGVPYTYGGWRRNDVAAGGYTLSHLGSNGLNVSNAWVYPKANRAVLSVTNAGSSPPGPQDPAYLATEKAAAAYR